MRFKMGQARHRILAGLQPLVDRAPCVAGGREMMGEEFGPPLDKIGETLLQCRRDTSVQFLPSCAQQGAIGGILDQRMLE